MSAETDKLIDEYLRSRNVPLLGLGDEYIWDGKTHIYCEHLFPILDIAEQYPQCMHANNCFAIVRDQQPKLTQPIKENNRLALAAQIAANPATFSALSGLMSQLPGIDKAVDAVKTVINNTAKQVPGKSGPAADIVNKITQVNALMNTALKGPTSLIFSTIISNLAKGFPEGGTGKLPANTSTLQQELQKLIASANNPTAYGAQFNRMAAMFPQVNINNLAAMASHSIGKKNPQALIAAIPQLASLAGSALKMLGNGTKHATEQPQPEKKVPPAPKPKPLIEPKNLFAPSAGGSSGAMLNGPVGALMGIAATVVSNFNQMSPSPQTTSAGTQKLTGTANTVYHGSGQYQPIQQDKRAQEMLELSYEIEQLQSEISNSVDLEKITTRTEAELREIYPALNESTTVAELIVAIEEWETNKYIKEIRDQFPNLS